jgi:hypothetical protein
MQERKTDMDTLIAKWVRDELTGDESAEFDAWCRKHVEALGELRELKEIWRKYGKFEIKRPGSGAGTWARIAERLRKI